MRTFAEGGNPGAVGLLALALAALGVLTFGWGSYVALAGAGALTLYVARAAQEERLPFPSEDDWRLDERTRAIARRGLRDARAALDRCRRKQLQRASKPQGGQG
jgi:fatty acid desaturase